MAFLSSTQGYADQQLTKPIDPAALGKVHAALEGQEEQSTVSASVENADTVDGSGKQ
jgi:hypothetical protein